MHLQMVDADADADRDRDRNTPKDTNSRGMRLSCGAARPFGGNRCTLGWIGRASMLRRWARLSNGRLTLLTCPFGRDWAWED
jgi:hypothetical protein